MKSFLARRHQIIAPSCQTLIFHQRTLTPPTAFIRSITKIKPERYPKGLTYRRVKEHQLALQQKEIQRDAKAQRYVKLAYLQENKPPVQISPFDQTIKNVLMQSASKYGLADATEEGADTDEEKSHKKASLAAKIMDADPQKALQLFNEALEVDPTLPPALLGRAALHELNNDMDRCYADFKKLSEVLHAKHDAPGVPYRLRFEDPILYEAETRLIIMDYEKGDFPGGNRRLYNILEHAPDEDLFRLATAVNGDISRMFHDAGNMSDHYYRDIVRSIPLVIKWTEKGRGLYTTRDIKAGETIWLERPLVSVPHNAKKTINACHFCGKVENDIQFAEPNISTVPPNIMHLLQNPLKIGQARNLSGDDLEKWYQVAENEKKNPQKDPNFLSEFEFRLRLRENNSNFEMFADGLRQSAVVDPFNLMRDSNGKTFCCRQCKEAAHQIYGEIDSHPSMTKMEKIAQKYDDYTGLLMARIYATYKFQVKQNVTPTIMDHLLRMTHPMTPSITILSEGDKEELDILLELFPDEATRKYIDAKYYFQLKNILNFNTFDLPSQALAVAVPKSFGAENSSVDITYDDKLSNTVVFTVASYLQHSCSPNVVPKPVLNGTKEIGFMATDDLPMGTPLTWSYVDETLPVHERRKILQEKYYFNCQCGRCFAELSAESPTLTLIRERSERQQKEIQEEIRAAIRQQMEERRRKSRTVNAEHTGPFLPTGEEGAQGEEAAFGELVHDERPVDDHTELYGFTEEAEIVNLNEPESKTSQPEFQEQQDVQEEQTTEEQSQEESSDTLQAENEELKKELERLKLQAENERLKKELEQLRAQMGIKSEPPKQEPAAPKPQPKVQAPTATSSQAKPQMQTPPPQPKAQVSTSVMEQPKAPTKHRTPTPEEITPFDEEEMVFVPSSQVINFDEQSLLEEEQEEELVDSNSDVPLWQDFEPPLPRPDEKKPSLDIDASESPFGEEEIVQTQPVEDTSLSESLADPFEILQKMNFSENVLNLVRQKMAAEQQQEQTMGEDLYEILKGKDDSKKDLL